jgi:hypothetical protein
MGGRLGEVDDVERDPDRAGGGSVPEGVCAGRACADGVAFADGGEGLVEAGAGAVGAREAVVEVDPIW